MHQNIQAALFEFTTVDDVVTKHHAIELLPACTYTTPAITMFGEPCANPMVNDTHTLTHPPVYVAEVKNYKMIGGCAFPIVDDKCVKPQLFDVSTWETWEQAKKLCMIQNNMIAYRGFKKHIKHDEKVINLVGNGSFNYAHWMTEFLPQLVLLKNNDIKLDGFKILIAEQSFQSMIDALLLLGIKLENIIRVPEFTYNELSGSLWVSPVANIVFQRPNALRGGADTLAEPVHALFHPEAIKATANYYLSLVDLSDKNKQPKYIYISRTAGRSKNQRNVLNEGAILDALVKLGFESVDPSKLSFEEQIKKFSNAICIVAPSGAALLNMLWAPKGANIVILMNDSKVANYWYFSNIAHALGHKVNYVLGKVVETGNWSDINHADFLVNLKELFKTLDDDLVQKSYHQNSPTKLNKIRKKKFAFLLHEPNLVAHYKSTWQTLSKDDYSVIYTPSFKSMTNESTDSVFSFMDELGIDFIYLYDLMAEDIKFEYSISNHPISRFGSSYICNFVAKKHIRFMYGADIGDGWSLQPWNEMYDYFLCHGENDRKAIENRFKGKTVIMGYPRYDGYFDPSLNTQSVINEFSLDSGKKTILWMPTLGGDYSSIPRFAEKLKHLTGQYNFIIRPHPISFVQEPDFIALLERCGYSIDRDAIRDMNALYRVTDVVLADNGGSPFSAIFLGKNVVFLEVPDDLGDNPNSHHIVNTSVNALKQMLPVISESSPETLTALLESEDFYIENCRQIEALFTQYFNCPRGGGAQRVADFLNSLD